MESYQKESVKLIRRHSQSVLQDIIIKGFKDESLGNKIRQTGRHRGDKALTPTFHHSLDSIITQKGNLIHLTGNNAVEIHKSYLKAQKESKKSNVTVTMTYLGQGLPGSAPDEMKVLQQICGGENICVFKGFVQPGGEESCSSPLFMPLGMERSVQKTSRVSKEVGVMSTDSEDLNGSVMERRRHKRHKAQRSQRADGKCLEEDSQPQKDARKPEEEPAFSITKQQPQTSANQDNLVSENKTNVPDSLQEGKTLNKHNGDKQNDPRTSNGKSSSRGRLKDFYEECVELSTGLESGLDQQRWFKANKIERNRIKGQLTSGPSAIGSASEVELSEESDSGDNHPESRKPKLNNKKGTQDDMIGKEQDLQKQMDAMTKVLNDSDEVEQLILRNTGLTDELLETLAAALKISRSEVTVINLNLNHIGPPGVRVLLDLLQAKPQIKELLLFGNQLGDLGVQNLLSGLAELQDTTAALHGNSERLGFSPFTVTIKELDLGGNGIRSDGLRVLATFMRHHSRLRYLGLAQTSCTDVNAWMVLFEGLKVNAELKHIILDECNLEDQGVKLFAESLRLNESLRKVDLDNNGFGDAGANCLLEALSFRGKCPLKDLSMEGNYVSTALMSKIQAEVESSRSNPV
ncbi:hypothetical protein E1301_Tti001793 [Triplophysa tibetana]|uniref:Uncharacterized protein n=1 Tax=Triplophysa tibetana TaxID=1572043 RepID=A0A5A9P2Y7_9TELE|nr:hypothetical protein E1301_Tti001793 [Triplophysa tibetana]